MTNSLWRYVPVVTQASRRKLRLTGFCAEKQWEMTFTLLVLFWFPVPEKVQSLVKYCEKVTFWLESIQFFSGLFQLFCLVRPPFPRILWHTVRTPEKGGPHPRHQLSNWCWGFCSCHGRYTKMKRHMLRPPVVRKKGTIFKVGWSTGCWKPRLNGRSVRWRYGWQRNTLRDGWIGNRIERRIGR